MPNVYRALPPLAALIGFEAAARLGSFSLAALELSVTQSAISHQIRTLEDHLQMPLFLRIGRRIALTDAGHDLQSTAFAALESVRLGVRRLSAYTKPNSVILSMSSALAMCWYLPRLQSLRADLPEIDPWLHISTEPEVREESEIDIVISDRAWHGPGSVTVPLAGDRLWPMASPAVAAMLPALPDGERLDRAQLLHYESQNDWLKWFAYIGSSRREISRGMNFSDAGFMLQAAAQGLGICLASEMLAADLLARGALVRVAERSMPVDGGFYLSAWKRNFVRPAVVQLWDWLVAQSVAG